MHWALNEVGL